MANDLSTPLSRRKERSPLRKALASGGLPRRLPIARILFGVTALLIAGIGLRVLLIDDPNGGRPQMEAALNTSSQPNRLATELTESSATSQAPSVAAEPAEGGPAIITVDEGAASPEAVAGEAMTADASGLIPDLVEETQYGSIPRMGPMGEMPFSAYARPSITPATADGKPLIAVIVTGLGLNEAGTYEAISKLPDNVTLAFAPYGKTLSQTVEAARAEGHELFLQLPLEPFDYPENDPGPETLLTGQPPRNNLDKLFWLMARFGGYAGVVNHMGARFTASGADFSPVMEELGTRGVGYLDDGSSNRSLAPQLAEVNKVPFGRADMTLDNNPAPGPILAALEGLEAKARDKGYAIGVISALPVSIETLAEWSEGLQDKGISLVPASALMAL